MAVFAALVPDVPEHVQFQLERQKFIIAKVIDQVTQIYRVPFFHFATAWSFERDIPVSFPSLSTLSDGLANVYVLLPAVSFTNRYITNVIIRVLSVRNRIKSTSLGLVRALRLAISLPVIPSPFVFLLLSLTFCGTFFSIPRTCDLRVEDRWRDAPHWDDSRGWGTWNGRRRRSCTAYSVGTPEGMGVLLNEQSTRSASILGGEATLLL